MEAEMAMARPSAAVRPHVGDVVGWWEPAAPGRVHRGLPSPHITLIATFDGAVDITASSDPGQEPGAYEDLVGGLHTSPVLIDQGRANGGVQVSVDPLSARRLLGLPGGALGRGEVRLEDVLGPLGRELRHRIAEAATWADRFAAVDDVLARLLARHDGARTPPPEVARAYRRIVASGGAVPIAEVAREVGWSRRHLGERFREEVGSTPKELAVVARFERAKRLLRAEAGRRTLADVAATCGYYDQSHLVRDWQALAGCAPSRWVEEEVLPSVQAAVPA